MMDKKKALHCITLTRNCSRVSDLYNSRNFGFDSVEIIQEDDGYRLVVQNIEIELYNGTFATISAAREAFEEIYLYFTKHGSLKLTPQWTDFFDSEFSTDEVITSVMNQS
jgi:hypothetical protein